jgi:hypothetical protein
MIALLEVTTSAGLRVHPSEAWNPIRLEHHLELSVVLLLQRVELPREVGVGLQHLPQAHERAHDLDVYENSTPTAEHAREHGDTLLSENVRAVATPAPPFRGAKLAPQESKLLRGQLEHEIVWESRHIPLDSPHQGLGFHRIECSDVLVQKHAVSTHPEHHACNPLRWNQTFVSHPISIHALRCQSGTSNRVV